MTPTHTFYGRPDVLSDGTPLEDGQRVTPNPDSPHDAYLIATGRLIADVDPPKRSSRKEDE